MTAPETGHKVEILCADGVVLGGNFWRPAGDPEAAVVINSATGVLARYYHRYARWLADEGFAVLTYDYRGIGASRPSDIRNCGYRWQDWASVISRLQPLWLSGWRVASEPRTTTRRPPV